jgi:hypothetical protein
VLCRISTKCCLVLENPRKKNKRELIVFQCFWILIVMATQITYIIKQWKISTFLKWQHILLRLFWISTLHIDGSFFSGNVDVLSPSFPAEKRSTSDRARRDICRWKAIITGIVFCMSTDLKSQFPSWTSDQITCPEVDLLSNHMSQSGLNSLKKKGP